MRPGGVYRRAGILLASMVMVGAALVVTHDGEFWPLSIYPMFSQGGHPWTRAIIRDVSGGDVDVWAPRGLEALPGEPFPTRSVGTVQNDLSNFVSKSRVWDAERLEAMRDLVGEFAGTRELVIYRVDGRLNDARVDVVATPVVLVTPDSTVLNPAMRPGRS